MTQAQATGEALLAGESGEARAALRSLGSLISVCRDAAFLPLIEAPSTWALMGALGGGAVQFAAGYDAGTWWTFAALAVVAGIAFAAVNQALVAVFGGAGRWIAALVGVLAVATGIVSTVPGILTQIAALMPTTPAYGAFLAALTSAGGLGAGLVGLGTTVAGGVRASRR